MTIITEKESIAQSGEVDAMLISEDISASQTIPFSKMDISSIENPPEAFLDSHITNSLQLNAAQGSPSKNEGREEAKEVTATFASLAISQSPKHGGSTDMMQLDLKKLGDALGGNAAS